MLTISVKKNPQLFLIRRFRLNDPYMIKQKKCIALLFTFFHNYFFRATKKSGNYCLKPMTFQRPFFT